MIMNDFTVAHLSSEQMEQLKKFENELGCTLVAYEEKQDLNEQSRLENSP
ncbi:hypothetical protein [Domibacillus antri]|nr:hypothetical protein [Domibacillus antri]